MIAPPTCLAPLLASSLAKVGCLSRRSSNVGGANFVYSQAGRGPWVRPRNVREGEQGFPWDGPRSSVVQGGEWVGRGLGQEGELRLALGRCSGGHRCDSKAKELSVHAVLCVPRGCPKPSALSGIRRYGWTALCRRRHRYARGGLRSLWVGPNHLAGGVGRTADRTVCPLTLAVTNGKIQLRAWKAGKEPYRLPFTCSSVWFAPAPTPNQEHSRAHPISITRPPNQPNDRGCLTPLSLHESPKSM